MRIIGGTCRGKKLSSPRGMDIRPTSDRVRESIFNIIRDCVEGSCVLDLFAGTGALGLEALSRGADQGVFIDRSPEACRIIEANGRGCRLESKATVLCHDLAGSFPAGMGTRGFDLVFMDPPYDGKLIRQVLNHPGFLEMITPGALLVAEHSVQENPLQEISMLDIIDQRKYGKTRITFLKPGSPQ